VRALKANHEHLFAPVVACFDGACVRGMKGDGIRSPRQWDEAHGRTEARRGGATSARAWRAGRPAWDGRRSVAMIATERFLGESLSVETRTPSAVCPPTPRC
jgi:hypothetical protein